MTNNKGNVRYIVNDVEEAIEFYKEFLDFSVDMDHAPGFAALSKGNLQLYLNKPGAGSGGAGMTDGETPEPGGWNRIQIVVEDLDSVYRKLKDEGAAFRNEIISSKSGRQALLRDPSGNFIELFEFNKSG